jgi:diacylglycerol kinase family enzyme
MVTRQLENSEKYKKMELAFIVNPTAGAGYASQVMSRLRDILEARGVAFRVVETERPGHGTELAASLAREEQVRAVIAVGGGVINDTYKIIAAA